MVSMEPIGNGMRELFIIWCRFYGDAIWIMVSCKITSL